MDFDLNESLRKRQAEMRELRTKGYTLEVIGKTYNLSHQRVQQILSINYGVRIHRDKIDKPKRQKLNVDWTNPEIKNTYVREAFRENRRKAIEILGGRCGRCGFTDMRALQIDHIHGGGTQEIRTVTAYARYKLIRDNPEVAKQKYQLLCANCNWIKRDENWEYGKKFKEK